MKKTVLLMLNSQCNVQPRCKHCYITSNYDKDPKDVIEIINSLRKKKYKITLLGSEVLMNLEYLKAYKLIGQKYLYTNGIIISKNPKVLEIIKENGINELRFSLHYGIISQLKSVKESIVLDAIKHARSAGFNIGIVITITKRNYKHGKQICDNAFKLGANYVEFIRFIKCGLAKTLDEKTLNEKERKDFFSLIKESRMKYSKKLEINVFGNFGPEKQKPTKEFCPAGKKLFVIDVDNKVYGCTFLLDFPIGTLEKNDLSITKDLCNEKRDKCFCDYLIK